MNHYHLVGYPNIKQFKRFFIQEGVGLVGANDLKIYNFTMSHPIVWEAFFWFFFGVTAKKEPRSRNPGQTGFLPSTFTSFAIFPRPHSYNNYYRQQSHDLTDGCLMFQRLF